MHQCTLRHEDEMELLLQDHSNCIQLLAYSGFNAYMRHHSRIRMAVVHAELAERRTLNITAATLSQSDRQTLSRL